MTIKALRVISIAYLLLPNFIFYFSWTRPVIASIGIGLLIFFIYDDSRDHSFDSQKGFSWKDLLIITTVALFLALVSGINGYTYQTKDHLAHNAKFLELLNYEWPVRLPDDKSAAISYYYGFYVVPSLVNKLMGDIVESFIFGWTWLGLSLGIGWLYWTVNKNVLYLWVILCLGDLPRIVTATVTLFFDNFYTLEVFGIENWSVFENLFWVPNQVIPALIIAGMFMYVLLNEKDVKLMVLPIAMSFWWAVFPAFVSGLLAAALVLRKWVLARFRLDWSYVTRKVILPFGACIPVLILFLSHEIIPVSGFVWEFNIDLRNLFRQYATNILLNVVLFVGTFMIFGKSRKNPESRLMFYISIFFCLVFPLYRMGEVNDLLIRGMMPILVMIGIYLSGQIAQVDRENIFKKSAWTGIVFLLLCCSSLLGMSRLWRAARFNSISDSAFKAMPYDAYANVYEVLKAEWSQEGADQYTGDKNSCYEKYIAPKR